MTDGRFLWWNLWSSCLTYRNSEASGRWTNCLPRAGDIVTVDQDTKEISMAVSDEELENVRQKQPTTTSIVVVSLVSDAHTLYLLHHVVLLQTSNMEQSGKNIN